MASEWLLLPIAFATSALTAAIGMGGGVVLLAAMPGLVPTAALMPLHAVTQFASNSSRLALGWRYIDRSVVLPLLLGSACGAIVGGLFYQALTLDYLPVVVGVMILVVTWWPLPQVKGKQNGAFALLGMYQTGLGMIAGATGPLGAAVLLRRSEHREYLVINTAVYMTINHFVRSVAFAVMGFAFSDWLVLLAALIVAVSAGSWLGTRLRRFVPQRNFQLWFRCLITVLAIRMIVMVWW